MQSCTGLELPNSFSAYFVPNEPSGWTDLTNKSVHTSDDQDIGHNEAVRRNFIVQNGLVNIHRYYVPLHRVEGMEGKVVWLDPKGVGKDQF